MPARKKKPETTPLRENEKKWGKSLVKAGWTMMPSTILERQQALELDPVDVNIIMQLVRHWWVAGEPPFPSHRTIADCIGMSISTVQRRLKKLERRGYIRTQGRIRGDGGRSTNYYDLKGLIDAATPLAEEALSESSKREQDRARRRVRKSSPAGHGLKIVQ